MKTYKDIVGDGGSDVVGQVTEQQERLAARLASVRHTVAVVSGKGGVGKSAVTVSLASALALGGRRVGILDADVNGPSVAKMAGVRGQRLRSGADGVEPAENALGIRVMSMDLFLSDDAAPVVWAAPTQAGAYTWRGTVEAAALRELLADTAWGDLDVLLLDLPPGTDKLPTLRDLLPRISGLVVVTLPSEVSQLIVGKSVEMARQLGVPVIGLVENMAGYCCPHCGETGPLFPPGETEALAERYGLPLLGRIPFDPRLSAALDAGAAFLDQHADTPAGQAARQVADRVAAHLTNAGTTVPEPQPDPP